jgi:hypothetical protein
MAALDPDIKRTLVMVYTLNTLVRGEVETKQAVRVSTWLRTQGVPDYFHLFQPTVIYFGSSIKVISYKEIYIPVTTVIGFHLNPPVTESLDYDESETNRVMVPATFLPGAFVFKGHVRISAQADLTTSIELAHSAWMSVYDVDVNCPSMPQMQSIHIPLVLINPKQVSLAIP